MYCYAFIKPRTGMPHSSLKTSHSAIGRPWSASCRLRPQELDDKIQELATNIPEVCRKSAIENREIDLIVAKSEKIILELHDYDTTHLDASRQVWTMDCNETFSEEYINRISLTPIELEYFKKKEVARRTNVHTDILPAIRDANYNFFKNRPFLPLASSTWTEKVVQRIHNQVWKLDTFNYTTPISVHAYAALARLCADDFENCRTAARNGTDYFPAGRNGLDADFPPLDKLERGKCPRKPLLYQKGIPKFPSDLVELKKLRNAGRPFLKCPCPGCEKNFTWFDHLFWFVIGNLDKLDPLAPSERIGMLEFQVLLHTTWKKVILAQIVFIFMREYMLKIIHLVIRNKRITTEEIIGYESFKEEPFVLKDLKFTTALLPNSTGIVTHMTNRRRPLPDD
ncbi:hypothetical protein CBR_g40364 [Chara braunii]|uniref:Uncharacterized protein n=1 Tax=Chara braunii TaxID=69332 RepID=A0A388LTQ0_CHABU|nr:hypothetical protein CBR_g40364 [Chara braunii]|eukprot:GBG85635.1 hypothetical protein CBR_g40364 [Chara braunii]